MTLEDGKYVVQGLQSFSKGCSNFDYRYFNIQTNLIQQSVNPSVYTKVSCYLPWIAEQNDMEYAKPDIIDSDCITGNGNINDVTAEICRTIPTRFLEFDLSVTSNGGGILTNYNIASDRAEAECILPYTFDGNSYTECLVSGIEDFTQPVFRCPIRRLRNRGTNYLSSIIDYNNFEQNEAVNTGYCPTNCIGSYYNFEDEVQVFTFNDMGPVFGPNGEYELDPGNNDCGLWRIRVFGVCKNNCPGVNFPVLWYLEALLCWQLHH